jgi:hypothetical protein
MGSKWYIQILSFYLPLVSLVIVYFPVALLFFSAPDDSWMLLNNPNVTSKAFNLEYLFKIIEAKGEIQYSPVNTLYYYLIYQINGYDPYYYHIGSLLVHTLNVYLVFKLSKIILAVLGVTESGTLSYLTCLLWAIHPLNVESVVWISASKVVLFSFFSLLSFYFFLLALNRNIGWYLLLSSTLFLLSCLIKEQALVMPLAMTLYIIFLKRKNELFNWRNRRLVFFLMSIFFVSVLTILISLHFNGSESGYSTPIVNYSIRERLVLSFYCLSFYITSSLVPMNLHFHYPYPFQPGEIIPLRLYLYPLLFILFIVLAFLRLNKEQNSSFNLFSILIFGVQICLFLQVIPLTRSTIMADRYMYLALIPLLWLYLNLINLWANSPGKKKLFYIAYSIYIIIYIVYSHNMVNNWKDLNIGKI